MKIGSLIIRSLILFSLAAPTAYSQVMRGCPAGHAIQGIDFAARSLICVPVVSPEALNAEAAARLAADQTLQGNITNGDTAALSNAKAYTDTKLADGDAVKVITVNCNGGKTIGATLADEGTKQPLVLQVQGTCAERVNIGRDDVTLEGDGTIAGPVTIDGAQRVVIDGLTITNPAGTGVTITNGGSATLQNNDISNNAAYGVFLRNASVAVVNNNKMINNGITGTDVDASGIGVAQASMVRASRNEIRENANTGIEVFDNSTYRGEGDIIAMRTSSPGRSAVDTFRAGLVDLRGVTVNGVVHVNQQSQLQVRNLAGAGGSSTITGNINVSGLSFLRLRSGVVRSSSTLSCAGLATICTCDDFPPSNVCPVSP
jgi:hypothetical protein